jgi:hypothetical protein
LALGRYEDAASIILNHYDRIEYKERGDCCAMLVESSLQVGSSILATEFIHRAYSSYELSENKLLMRAMMRVESWVLFDDGWTVEAFKMMDTVVHQSLRDESASYS